ncbi:MAG: Na+/H+ antiporter NhaA [Candidatus Odinarchaeota archaeon]
MVESHIKYFKKVPKAPIQKLSRSFSRFTRNSMMSGFIVIFAVIIALIWANSPWFKIYTDLLAYQFAFSIESFHISKSLLHWINDGIMALFFFLIGLEIKREILIGELSNIKYTLPPLFGAFGGMVFPAIIYMIFNPPGSAGFGGWAIPVATDIAFSLVVLALLGSRVPLRLKIFLTTLAIFDDIGAVILIAVFFTSEIHWNYIIFSLVLLLILFIINRIGFRNVFPYALFGFLLWFCMFESGIHATLAGILVALTIPATTRIDFDEFKDLAPQYMARIIDPGLPAESSYAYSIRMSAVQSLENSCKELEAPLRRLEHFLVPWVSFVVVPSFALANSGITIIQGDLLGMLLKSTTLGVFFGLTIGKPLGIFLMIYVLTRLEVIQLPSGISLKEILGAGCIAGIGFTMSFLIANLAFQDMLMLDSVKLGIIIASVVSGTTGWLLLKKFYL